MFLILSMKYQKQTLVSKTSPNGIHILSHPIAAKNNPMEPESRSKLYICTLYSSLINLITVRQARNIFVVPSLYRYGDTSAGLPNG